MDEIKIQVVQEQAQYRVMGAPTSPCDLEGVLTYLLCHNVPGHIMKQVRVTLPQRKALTVYKPSDQEAWYILYPPT